MKRLVLPVLALPLLLTGLSACKVELHCDGSPCHGSDTVTVDEGAPTTTVDGQSVTVSDVTRDSAAVTVNGVKILLRKGQIFTVGGTTVRLTLHSTDPGAHKVNLRVEN
jgi:hypothetical protein